MIELNENFSLADLGNVKKEAFEILYNKTRVSSCEGTMYLTPDKMYYIVAPVQPSNNLLDRMGGVPKSWCLDLSEIASYGKYGLGGFKLDLKDGNTVRFTNVFRKTRNAIVEALEERQQK